jgi:hypothetical protein
VCDERNKRDDVQAVTTWVEKVLSECEVDVAECGNFFPGYHESTIGSLVLAVAAEEVRRDSVRHAVQTAVLTAAGTDGVAGDPDVHGSGDRSSGGGRNSSSGNGNGFGGGASAFSAAERASAAAGAASVANPAELTGDEALVACQERLVLAATPLAILKSASLRRVKQAFFEDKETGKVQRAQMHASLGSFLLDRYHALSPAAVHIGTRTAAGGWPTSFSVVMTRSPSAHLDNALAETGTLETAELQQLLRGGLAGRGQHATKLQLANFDSETSFTTEVRAFFETVGDVICVFTLTRHL